LDVRGCLNNVYCKDEVMRDGHVGLFGLNRVMFNMSIGKNLIYLDNGLPFFRIENGQIHLAGDFHEKV
jgi:hypothetical protein